MNVYPDYGLKEGDLITIDGCGYDKNGMAVLNYIRSDNVCVKPVKLAVLRISSVSDGVIEIKDPFNVRDKPKFKGCSVVKKSYTRFSGAFGA